MAKEASKAGTKYVSNNSQRLGIANSRIADQATILSIILIIINDIVCQSGIFGKASIAEKMLGNGQEMLKSYFSPQFIETVVKQKPATQYFKLLAVAYTTNTIWLAESKSDYFEGKGHGYLEVDKNLVIIERKAADDAVANVAISRQSIRPKVTFDNLNAENLINPVFKRITKNRKNAEYRRPTIYAFYLDKLNSFDYE